MIRAHLALLLPLLACAPPGPDMPGMASQGFRSPVFVSPMGEPFRAAPGTPPPMDAWFMRVDADHDGRVTVAEFTADATAWFARLDQDGSGGLVPAEITAYEAATPELSSMPMPAGPPGGMPMPGGPGGAGGPPRGLRMPPPDMQGAARFGLLAIPHPVASADHDLDRTITRAEFAAAAQRRFALLDQAKTGILTLDTLQPPNGRRPARP